MSGSDKNWVRFAPNGQHLGGFKIDLVHFGSPNQNVLKSDLKKTLIKTLICWFVQFGANLTQFGTNLDMTASYPVGLNLNQLWKYLTLFLILLSFLNTSLANKDIFTALFFVVENLVFIASSYTVVCDYFFYILYYTFFFILTSLHQYFNKNLSFPIDFSYQGGLNL